MKTVKINPANVVRAQVYPKEYVTNEFWWTDDVYKKTWFGLGKPKKIISEGFVPKVLAGGIGDVKYWELIIGSKATFTANELRHGEFWCQKYEVIETDKDNNPVIIHKPHVNVTYVNGNEERFYFNSTDEATSFCENIFCHPTTYNG